MDNQARQKLLRDAEAAQAQFEKTLERSGLSMSSLRAMADQIRAKLPRAERCRVEDAARALVTPQARHLPGTSDLTAMPVGIRG